jgi:hypothetical protein
MSREHRAVWAPVILKAIAVLVVPAKPATRKPEQKARKRVQGAEDFD